MSRKKKNLRRLLEMPPKGSSLSLYSSSLFPKAIVGYRRITVGVIRFLLFFRLLGKNPGFFNLYSLLCFNMFRLVIWETLTKCIIAKNGS